MNTILSQKEVEVEKDVKAPLEIKIGKGTVPETKKKTEEVSLKKVETQVSKNVMFCCANMCSVL